MQGMQNPITETEIEKFLEGSRLNIQVATIDENGYPNIHPTWFHYDRHSEKLTFVIAFLVLLLLLLLGR